MILKYRKACPYSNFVTLMITAKGLQQHIKLDAQEEKRFVNGKGWPQPRLYNGKKLIAATGLEIAHYLNTELNEQATNKTDYYPEKLRAKIDLVLETTINHLINGAYAAGSVEDYQLYVNHYQQLFERLELLDHRLNQHTYSCGEQLTIADWLLLSFLIRFDLVYYELFFLNWQRVVDYPNLWNYTRLLYQMPGVCNLVDLDYCRIIHFRLAHYNPSKIIPKGPEIDFMVPPQHKLR